VSEAPSCGPTFTGGRSAQLRRAETATRAARQITHQRSDGGTDVPLDEKRDQANETTSLDLVWLWEAS